MANFCGKCGTPLDASGLCPKCVPDKPASAFCGHCGSAIDSKTGHCPNPVCGGKKAVTPPAPAIEADKAQITASAPVSDEQKEPQKKPKKKKGALSVIITILLSVCLFLTAFNVIIAYAVQKLPQEKSIEKILDGVSFSEMYTALGISSEENLQKFYDGLEMYYGIEMTDKKLDEFIHESTVKEFIAEEISLFVTDFVEGDDPDIVLTKKEVADIFKENRKLMEKEFDVDLEPSDMEVIAGWLFASEKVEIASSDTMQDIREDAPVLYTVIKSAFSPTVTLFLLAVCLILIVLMLINSPYQASKGIGVDLTILGGSGSVVSIIAIIVAEDLFALNFGGPLVAGLLGYVTYTVGLISILMFVLGLILLIVPSVIRKAVRKKKNIA